MRILFVADGRSPIALNWMSYFVDRGYQVHLVSTYLCEPELALASLDILPVAMSSSAGDLQAPASQLGRLIKIIPVSMRTAIRQRLGPYTIPKAAHQMNGIIERVQPDLVHAMRIPYEGMLVAMSEPRVPLLVSVWGNDFTLHAPATSRMRQLTKLTLQRAKALHTDCERDRRLAYVWGFSKRKPAIVLPGAGGIQMDIFYPSSQLNAGDTNQAHATVINPRGIRAYVCNEAFFRAIPIVLVKRPGTRFVCPAMAGEAIAEHWVEEFGVQTNVELLPRQTRGQMADLYRQSQVAVSPSTHDGTPNTLLEAMACGCFPVAGDIESLREWITPGANGLLVDPHDPQAIADAILTALEHLELRVRAKHFNLELIFTRAEYIQVMKKAEQFYKKISSQRS